MANPASQVRRGPPKPTARVMRIRPSPGANPRSRHRGGGQPCRMASSSPTALIIRTPRIARWLRRAAIAMLLAPLLPVAAVIGAGFSLSAPAPAVIGPPPDDPGAGIVTIASPSGSQLKGWYVAGRPGGGAVVLLHGVHANRLSMVRRARLCKDAGVWGAAVRFPGARR